MVAAFSTDHVDYLQWSDFSVIAMAAEGVATLAPPERRRLWRIHGIGRKAISRPSEWGGVGLAGFGPGTTPGRQRSGGGPGSHPITQDILVGLYGYNIPLAFVVTGDGSETAIYLGTWSPTAREPRIEAPVLDGRQAILQGALESLFPSIQLTTADPRFPPLPHAGLALGIPTYKPPEAYDGAEPLDRLIRALRGMRWMCLVLADPVDAMALRRIQESLLKELRAALTAAEAAQAPSPLMQYYAGLLESALTALFEGQAVGAWRVGVYLLGDDHSFYRLAALWRGIYSGEESVPEPVRVWRSAAAGELALHWALPDISAPGGPGFV